MVACPCLHACRIPAGANWCSTVPAEAHIVELVLLCMSSWSEARLSHMIMQSCQNSTVLQVTGPICCDGVLHVACIPYTFAQGCKPSPLIRTPILNSQLFLRHIPTHSVLVSVLLVHQIIWQALCCAWYVEDALRPCASCSLCTSHYASGIAVYFWVHSREPWLRLHRCRGACRPRADSGSHC